METRLEIVGKAAVLKTPTLRVEILGDKNHLVGITTEDSEGLLDKTLEVVKEFNKVSDIYKAIEEVHGYGALMAVVDKLEENTMVSYILKSTYLSDEEVYYKGWTEGYEEGDLEGLLYTNNKQGAFKFLCGCDCQKFLTSNGCSNIFKMVGVVCG